MSDALTVGSVAPAAVAARICAAHADSTSGVGLGAPPGKLTCPLAPNTGSGTFGMPCLRAHPMAARAAARLPGDVPCWALPPPRLGTVELLLADPHAASAIAARADTGIRRSERFILVLSRSGEAKLRAGAGPVVSGAADFATTIVRPLSR